MLTQGMSIAYTVRRVLGKGEGKGWGGLSTKQREGLPVAIPRSAAGTCAGGCLACERSVCRGRLG